MKPYPKLSEQIPSHKRVLVRVDFDVAMQDGVIVDDMRIRTHIPTLQLLLSHHNTLILMAKRGRPQGRDPQLSLQPIADILSEYIPDVTTRLVDDFLSSSDDAIQPRHDREVVILENIRYYSDKELASSTLQTKLCHMADVYVMDAFAMAHRDEYDITTLPLHIPTIAGLALEKEEKALSHVLQHPTKPFVSVIGGAKIETKLEPIQALMKIADVILVGGGIANTLLKAHGYEIGESLYDPSEKDMALEILEQASKHPVQLVLPMDVRVGDPADPHSPADTYSINKLPTDSHILDIGPGTQELYEEYLSRAHTILWNGPMGLFEHDSFRHGTDAIYKAIVNNRHAFSLVGGGDTLAALARKRQTHEIDHISTGGGAMLDMIAYGDLPAFKALRASPSVLY